MTNTARQAHNLLIIKRKTVAVAESCTGGLLSSLLTRLPDSSAYFLLGIVAYSNKAKEHVLKVPHSVIAKHSAVSKNVTLGLAQSIRRIAKTDFGIGLTGIAGPTGTDSRNPIGTVFVAISSRNKTICKKFIFRGRRLMVIKKSAREALKLLIQCLKEK